ncbi:MAG: hypothetical protein HYT83_01515 [Candidatus Levybacteria bacterium]|nr:hypothetical protein [Candidatus Levybacteria bacterium]
MVLAEKPKLNGAIGPKESLAFVVPPRALATCERGISPAHKEIIERRLVELNILEEDIHAPFMEKPNPHSGSEGQYYLEGTFGEYEVYAYTLGPNKTTSIHHHPEGMTERIEVIAGEALIKLNDEVNPFKNAIIGSNVRHQCSTAGSSAVILAITHNPNKIPKEEIHRRPFDSWEADWEKDKERGIDIPEAVPDILEAA